MKSIGHRGAERRTFTRICFDAETVVTQGEHIWPVELIDISLRGVLVKNPGDMALDMSKPAQVSIHLAGDLVISMEVRVKHQEEDRLGMQRELSALIHE